jgi:hypothetical protein
MPAKGLENVELKGKCGEKAGPSMERDACIDDRCRGRKTKKMRSADREGEGRSDLDQDKQQHVLLVSYPTERRCWVAILQFEFERYDLTDLASQVPSDVELPKGTKERPTVAQFCNARELQNMLQCESLLHSQRHQIPGKKSG